MSHQQQVVLEVHRIELGVASARAQCVQGLHRDAVLQISFATARNPSGGEERAAENQACTQLLEGVAVPASVVVCQSVEVEVGDEVIQARCHPAGPIHLLARWLLRKRVARILVADVEHLQGLLPHTVNAGLRDLIHPGLKIVHFQDFDVGAQQATVLGEVAVHIEHPGVGMPEKPDPASAEGALHAQGVQPARDLAPRGLSGRMIGRDLVRQGVLCLGREAEQACDDVEADARPLKGVRDLGNAAGLAVREPLSGARVRVVETGRRLQVQHEHRTADLLNGRQHLAARGVRGHIADDQVHAFAHESVSSRKGLWLVVHHTHIHNLDPHSGHLLADELTVSGQPISQAFELRPVRGQADAEQADFAGGLSHRIPDVYAE